MAEFVFAILAGCFVGIVVSFIVGGPILMFVCWLINEWLVKENRFQGKCDEEKLQAPLKTTDAGPYTAPGVDWMPGERGDSPRDGDPQKIPIPNIIYAGAIAACAFVAMTGVHYAILVFFDYLANEWVVFPGSFIVLLLTSLLATFFAATAIHTAMLPTTLLRGAAITFFVLVPWVSIGVTIFVICHA